MVLVLQLLVMAVGFPLSALLDTGEGFSSSYGWLAGLLLVLLSLVAVPALMYHLFRVARKVAKPDKTALALAGVVVTLYASIVLFANLG